MGIGSSSDPPEYVMFGRLCGLQRAGPRNKIFFIYIFLWGNFTASIQVSDEISRWHQRVCP